MSSLTRLEVYANKVAGGMRNFVSSCSDVDILIDDSIKRASQLPILPDTSKLAYRTRHFIIAKAAKFQILSAGPQNTLQ